MSVHSVCNLRFVGIIHGIVPVKGWTNYLKLLSQKKKTDTKLQNALGINPGKYRMQTSQDLLLLLMNEEYI